MSKRMNDAELRSLERLCSKDDLSDDNVATLTVLGLKAADEIRTLRAAMPTAEEREALEEMAETVRGMFHGQPQAALALAALAKLTKETP